jgi:hypothetical protein
MRHACVAERVGKRRSGRETVTPTDVTWRSTVSMNDQPFDARGGRALDNRTDETIGVPSL